MYQSPCDSMGQLSYLPANNECSVSVFIFGCIPVPASFGRAASINFRPESLLNSFHFFVPVVAGLDSTGGGGNVEGLNPALASIWRLISSGASL